VLGAGVAGLTVAYELGKAGYECTLLEAQLRPGGRTWTLRSGEKISDSRGDVQEVTMADHDFVEAGATRFSANMVTMDYCKELNLPIEPMVAQNADGLIAREDGPPVRYRAARADAFGYLSELLAKAADRGNLDEDLSAEDKEHVLAFLRDFGAITRVGGHWTYRPRGADSASGGVGPATLADVLGSRVGRAVTVALDYDKAVSMYRPVGGMTRIVEALVERVGRHRIRYGSQVVAIGERPDRVDVGYRDPSGRTGRASADACVVALPPHLMAGIAHNLGPEVAGALHRLVPRPAVKVGMVFRRRWWEEDGTLYGGVSDLGGNMEHLWYPSHGFHSTDGGVLVDYSQRDEAISYGEMKPAARVARAFARCRQLHPGARPEELTSGFSVAWQLAPFHQAAWNLWCASATERERRIFKEGVGRLYFAGDWASGAGGWQAGAFTSAREAATHIHQRFAMLT
jgi:monoamine oxidase